MSFDFLYFFSLHTEQLSLWDARPVGFHTGWGRRIRAPASAPSLAAPAATAPYPPGVAPFPERPVNGVIRGSGFFHLAKQV